MKRLFSLLLLITMAISSACARQPIKALIISGQNNHNWKVSHRVLQTILNESSLFEADIVLTAEAGGDMSGFHPDFSLYDVVVLDYNGDRWPAETDAAFLEYVQSGGGVVLYHAADNAFADWEEFNKIIALGGWEGRTESAGPYYYLVDGKPTLDYSAGPGGSHGSEREYPMHCRTSDHPITRGLPDNWIHGRDEMYDRMRGPANIKDLLYSARIFHLMLGHAGPTADNSPAMQCAGFQTLLLRGAEWAATGKVTQPVPEDFPTAEKASFRLDYKAPADK